MRCSKSFSPLLCYILTNESTFIHVVEFNKRFATNLCRDVMRAVSTYILMISNDCSNNQLKLSVEIKEKNFDYG